MKKPLKPRFRKSRPAKIHIGTPIVMRGWKLPCKWDLTARREFGDAYQKMRLVRGTLEEARATALELIGRGWDSCEIREREILLPLKKAVATP